jgi:nucleoside-diphosphate-sugar epimerase
VKYLVTGGAGFIGSALVKRLVADGHNVTVLDDFSRGRAERLAGLPITLIPGDVRQELKVHSAVHGQDCIIHLAYLQGTQTFYAEPRQVLDVAVRGMLNILNACEQHGVGSLMLASSSEAYQVAAAVPTPETIPLTVPDPLNPRYSYGGGKIACEIMANAWHRAGVLDRLIIARPHNIYGPDMGREHVIHEFCIRMNRLVHEQPEGIIEFPIQGSGQETRAFCYIEDCTDQLVSLLDTGDSPAIYNVGRMDERSISAVAQKVADRYARQIKILPGTLPKGSPPRRLPDMAKTEAAGGYRPRWSFSDGMARTVDWYKTHG